MGSTHYLITYNQHDGLLSNNQVAINSCNLYHTGFDSSFIETAYAQASCKPD